MNYAKVIDAAIQLFPKKINVTLIDGVTGNKIGKYKTALNELPAVFDRPVMVDIDGRPWRVIQADPLSADDFGIFKKLTLHVLEPRQSHQLLRPYTLPTQHAERPLLAATPPYTDFTLEIPADDWLQLQFLPAAALPVVQEEITPIESILAPTNGQNPLLGYESMHIRNRTVNMHAGIPFSDFCESIPVKKIGSIRIGWDNNAHPVPAAGDSYVDNGFAIQTDNSLYYGTAIDDRIINLGLTSFDSFDEEFAQVAAAHELLLADWCNARIIMIQNDLSESTPTASLPDTNQPF